MQQPAPPPVAVWPGLLDEPAAQLVDATRSDEEDVSAPICYVRRGPWMDDLEWRLRDALVAFTGGNRPSVLCDQVARALRERLGAHGFSVHPHHPEGFLIVLASEELKRRVTASPSLPCAGSKLFFWPCTCLAYATKVYLRTKVHLVLEGIPPHAWDQEVAEDLVGTTCKVEGITPKSRSRTDLALFRMTAWTDDPEMIPSARTLVILEPVPAPVVEQAGERTELETPRYHVLIHIDKLEDEIRPMEGWLDCGAVAGGQSGIPDSCGGGDRLRMTMSMPWKRGVQEQRGGTRSPGNSSQRRSYCQVVVGSLDWHLPPMERQIKGHMGSRGDGPASDPLHARGQKLPWRVQQYPRDQVLVETSTPLANQMAPAVQILWRIRSPLPVLEEVPAPTPGLRQTVRAPVPEVDPVLGHRAISDPLLSEKSPNSCATSGHEEEAALAASEAQPEEPCPTEPVIREGTTVFKVILRSLSRMTQDQF
jgi:hypothetical protein